jgi:NAD(P)-dependent dehydrogenase (short-subunit alcohol dehydrogenase family)
MTVSLTDHVYAMIARGDETDRAIAVALAEAGAAIAIATIASVQQDEFATASIANEVWAMGREQFSFPLDASNSEHVQAFANEVLLRLGRCDGIILGLGAPYEALQSFLTAVPTARPLWLAVENIGDGAVPVRDTPAQTAAAVLSQLA